MCQTQSSEKSYLLAVNLVVTGCRITKLTMAHASLGDELENTLKCAVCSSVSDLEERGHTTFICQHSICGLCMKNTPQGSSTKCPICLDTEMSKLIINFGVVDLVDKLCQSCSSRMQAAKCEHCEEQVCDVWLETDGQDFYTGIKQKMEELREGIRHRAEMSLDDTIQDQEISKADETVAAIQMSMQLHLDALVEGHNQLQVRAKQTRGTNTEQDMTWRKDITSQADNESCKPVIRKSKDALEIRYSKACTSDMLSKLNKEASDMLKPLQDLQTSVPRPTQYTFVTPHSQISGIGPPSIKSRSSPTPTYNYARARSIAMSGNEDPGPEKFIGSGNVICMGDRYIASDSFHHRLKVFDSKLTLISILGEIGGKDHQFNYPTGLCTGRDGELFVSDTANNRIKVYSKNLQLVRQFGSRGSGDKEFERPRGLAVTSTGDLLVCDTDNYRVKVHKPDGSYIRSIGSKGAGTGKFSEQPVSLAVTQADNLLVVERFAAYLHVFRINGDYVRRVTPNVPGSSVDIQMWGFAVDPDENIIVTDTANHRLIVLDAEGKFVCTIGSRGIQPGEMDQPWSVALNTDNRQIIVYEIGNNKLQLFEA